jgi:hypothetical protein
LAAPTKFAEGVLLYVKCVPREVKLCVTVMLWLSREEQLKLMLPEGLPLGEADGTREAEGASEAVAPGVRVPPITLGSNAVGYAGSVGPFAVALGACCVPEGDARPETVTDGELVGDAEGRRDTVKDVLPEDVLDDVVDGEIVGVAAVDRDPLRVAEALTEDVEDALGAALAVISRVPSSLGERPAVTVCVPVRG